VPSVLSAAHFHSEEAAYRFVESRLWTNGRPCPHCGVIDKSGPLKGNSTRIGVYKCYACRKPFTVKVGTVFESSHVKLHVWLQAMHLLCSSKKGMSSNQLHRVLGITLQTAWFLSHRIREAMTDLRIDDIGPLGGEGKFVESDETFIGGRARNRAYRAPAPKKAVVALVERKGRVRSHHVPEVNAANLRPILEKGIDKASHLRTDESGVYWETGEKFASHQTVVHSQDETSAAMPTLIPRKTSSLFLSAGSMASISTSARSTCIAISPSSISGIPIASRSESMILSVPIGHCAAASANGLLIERLIGKPNRGTGA
jgi:transposase-like protein